MKVLMVGVSKKRVGGMNTVSQMYINNKKYNENVKLNYVSTSTNGCIFTRMLCMLFGYIRIFFILIFCKIDLVHIHMAEKGSTFRKGFVAKINKKFGKKVIIHLHAGPFVAWYSTLNINKQEKIKKIFSYADKVLVLGEYWKKELSNIFDENKLIVLYNGVKCPNENMYNINSKNIVYFGVMRKEKGTYDLINAMKLIDKKLDKDIKLLLYGNDLVGDIQEVINKLGLNDRVKMMGWISGEEVDNVLKDSMIDILPSYYEGLSMTIIEGLSYGIPIITTNISTMPEILEDYDYLIEPGDVKTLGKYILDLVNSEEKRKKISNYEYERACKVFSEEKFIDNTLSIYQDIFKGEI